MIFIFYRFSHFIFHTSFVVFIILLQKYLFYRFATEFVFFLSSPLARPTAAPIYALLWFWFYGSEFMFSRFQFFWFFFQFFLYQSNFAIISTNSILFGYLKCLVNCYSDVKSLQKLPFYFLIPLIAGSKHCSPSKLTF